MKPNRQSAAQAAMMLAALATALALSGCGRALPTSPDYGLEPNGRNNAAPSSLVVSDGDGNEKTPGSSWGPPPPYTEGGSDDPVSLGGPSGLPTSYFRAGNKLVKPYREVTVAGGRWSLAFHSGSLAVKKVVSIDQAADGTVRAQLSPANVSFAQAVDITIDYAGSHMDPAAAGYVAGSSPTLFRYDAVSRTWVRMAATNDAAHKLLHAHLTQLGVYGVGTGTSW